MPDTVPGGCDRFDHHRAATVMGWRLVQRAFAAAASDEWLREHRTAALLLIRLADAVSDNERECFVGSERMGEWLGVSRQTAAEHRDALEAAGYLVAVPVLSEKSRKLMKDERGQGRRPNFYVVTLPELAAEAPGEPNGHHPNNAGSEPAKSGEGISQGDPPHFAGSHPLISQGLGLHEQEEQEKNNAREGESSVSGSPEEPNTDSRDDDVGPPPRCPDCGWIAPAGLDHKCRDAEAVAS